VAAPGQVVRSARVARTDLRLVHRGLWRCGALALSIPSRAKRGRRGAGKGRLFYLSAVFWEQRVWLLMLVLVIGSVGSHMPGRFRYYSLLHRRVIW